MQARSRGWRGRAPRPPAPRTPCPKRAPRGSRGQIAAGDGARRRVPRQVQGFHLQSEPSSYPVCRRSRPKPEPQSANVSADNRNIMSLDGRLPLPRVVLLCGGLGTRMREETEYRPKPMVEIGGRPLLWHIMKIFGAHGFNDFVCCLGCRGDAIKRYFLDYHALSSDVTVEIASGKNE